MSVDPKPSSLWYSVTAAQIDQDTCVNPKVTDFYSISMNLLLVQFSLSLHVFQKGNVESKFIFIIINSIELNGNIS